MDSTGPRITPQFLRRNFIFQKDFYLWFLHIITGGYVPSAARAKHLLELQLTDFYQIKVHSSHVLWSASAIKVNATEKRCTVDKHTILELKE